jgi:hypothetical protein
MAGSLVRCQSDLPSDLRAHLIAFAKGWAQHALRPHPKQEVSRSWDNLMIEWSQDTRLPLLIRKMSKGRGVVVRHESGRMLVPVDNSPAQWAFAQACGGSVPSIEDIVMMFANDQIPVAMILKRDEKEKARYRCVLGKQGTAHAGWKLGHIRGVGLGSVGSLELTPIDTLVSHFCSLMSPSNMFAVPLEWSGMAEIPEVLQAIRDTLQGEA